ncbi:MAG TPA: PadR family transcriptional regulator, partial [Coleofasciculaceae cyanobacterium]
KPQSGYDLTQWIAQAAHHYWAADHSSIYPALADLERQGFVNHEMQKSERGPKRKVYSITTSGRNTLLAWVDLPPAEAEIRDEQLVKALCYDLIDPEQAIAQLQISRQRYVAKLTWCQESLQRLDQQGTVSAADSAYRGRLGIRLTIRRGVLSATAGISWCDEAIALMQTHHRSDLSEALNTQTPSVHHEDENV